MSRNLHSGVFRALLVISLVCFSYLAFAPLDAVPIPTISDKLNHLATFLVLAGLWDFSFPGSHFGARAVLALLAYGLLIEVVQYHLPYRQFELADLAVDALGIALYPVATLLLRRLPYLRRRWS